ncbi:uncharacterized protein AKAW2_80609S [Aspergillus luchuensis]|uniref:Uncharacterized protein n=1 Tax=Aspergillus kawachii TaxID=1069201 RepID=A0A7R8A5F4_ASPKA|nr:uncharacterized protein AKAW2_80609S [Aspergillus luchuensis]BCS04808.1 hypothetical protein AKAW2_80609S [Aspergillus luchuensis]
MVEQQDTNRPCKLFEQFLRQTRSNHWDQKCSWDYACPFKLAGMKKPGIGVGHGGAPGANQANQALSRKVPPHLSQLGQARGAVTRSGWNQHRMTLEAPVQSFVSCSCCSSNGSNAAGLRDQFTAEWSANAKLLLLVHQVLLYPPPRQQQRLSSWPNTSPFCFVPAARWIDIYLSRHREGSLLGKTIVGSLSCLSAAYNCEHQEDKGGFNPLRLVSRPTSP